MGVARLTKYISRSLVSPLPLALSLNCSRVRVARFGISSARPGVLLRLVKLITRSCEDLSRFELCMPPLVERKLRDRSLAPTKLTFTSSSSSFFFLFYFTVHCRIRAPPFRRATQLRRGIRRYASSSRRDEITTDRTFSDYPLRSYCLIIVTRVHARRKRHSDSYVCVTFTLLRDKQPSSACP